MADAEGRFSQGVLVLAFILGLLVMTQSVQIIEDLEYSEYGIPLWKGLWEDSPERLRVHLILKGRLSEVEYPDWGYGPEAYSEYSGAMVLESTNSEYQHVPERVYLWDDEGKTGLIPSKSAGGFDVGDATFPKWVQALCEGWTIEAEGYAFDVTQEGQRLTLFGVEKLLSTQKSEEIHMYEEVHASAMSGGVVTGNFPLPLPVRFQAGRIHRGDTWQDNAMFYGMRMDAGETIYYYFNSDKPVHFKLIYSNTTSFMDWRTDQILIEEPSIMTNESEFSAKWDGFYVFGFEGGDPSSRVVLNALRKTGDRIFMPAWILGGKTGGGSGPRIKVNMSDLSQFLHLIEAFEEDAEASSRGYVHADHATFCPGEEAIRIIKFLGEEYSTQKRDYWFKLITEDGSYYSFSIYFSWEPPIVS